LCHYLKSDLLEEFAGATTGKFLADYNEQRPGPPLLAGLPAFPGEYCACNIKKRDA
jgi:hypothetical protein